LTGFAHGALQSLLSTDLFKTKLDREVGREAWRKMQAPSGHTNRLAKSPNHAVTTTSTHTVTPETNFVDLTGPGEEKSTVQEDENERLRERVEALEAENRALKRENSELKDKQAKVVELLTDK
jgi:hypothetical protein